MAAALTLAAWGAAPADPTAQPAPSFYAYCVGEGGGTSPGSLADEAKLLREIGFNGAGNRLWLGNELDRNLKVLDQAGLQTCLLWTTVNVNPAKGAPYDPQVPTAIRKLARRPSSVCVLMSGFPSADTNGLAVGVKALRELGDVAAEAGVRISIYNHADTWAERVPFIVQVVKQVNHPQVGFNFNVCHWLKVEREKDYRPVLQGNAAKLFAVTICGADITATNWTNGLIQPLDRGNFENRVLLGFLGEIGYRGPIGLMCYGVPGEPREHLARSMKVWRNWHGLR